MLANLASVLIDLEKNVIVEQFISIQVSNFLQNVPAKRFRFDYSKNRSAKADTMI